MTYLSLLIGLLWTGSVAHADTPCAAPASQVDLQASLQRAETAFAALDVETFTRSMDDAIFLVPCLSEPVDANVVARLHRLQGIRQFVANEEDRAVQAFAAARSADPDYQLPVWLVAEGSAIRDLYGRMPLENGNKITVPAPVGGSILFDGVSTLDRPAAWASLAQVLDGGGRVIETAYLFPGDAMPAYAAVNEPTLSKVNSDSTSGDRRPGRKVGFGLIGASVGSAVAAGVLYGVASGSASDFLDPHPEWGTAGPDEARFHTNNLIIASGALGAIAAGAGLSAAFVVKW